MDSRQALACGAVAAVSCIADGDGPKHWRDRLLIPRPWRGRFQFEAEPLARAASTLSRKLLRLALLRIADSGG